MRQRVRCPRTPAIRRAATICILGALALHADTARADCTVSSSGLAFGAYNIFDASPLDSTGTVTVDCTGTFGAVVNVKISAGASASFTSRKLWSGGHPLLYNLYRDPSHTTVWGDGSSSTDFATAAPASGAPLVLTVFGRIPDRQTTAYVGSYGDTPVVTVEF